MVEKVDCPEDVGLPSLVEAMGLRPFSLALRQARLALLGSPDVPASKTGFSSLALLSPRLAIPLWRGTFPVPRRVILSNLFNHTQTPEAAGWSTLRTQVLDFRGREQTYDSHNGTDLCIPRGTLIVAPAAGQVGRVFREFNRGGLKIAIDHGEGLMTCCVHLARALVTEGEIVRAGQAIAVSGYSGLDGFATFPWGIPHVHFNTWLHTRPVDPFSTEGDVSLWHSGQPTPCPVLAAVSSTATSTAPNHDQALIVDSENVDFTGNKRNSTRFVASAYDDVEVDRLIDSCTAFDVRQRLRAITPLWRRAAHVICERNYYPTRFAARQLHPKRADRAVYARLHPRRERLWLPMSKRDFDGVVFRDAC